MELLSVHEVGSQTTLIIRDSAKSYVHRPRCDDQSSRVRGHSHQRHSPLGYKGIAKSIFSAKAEQIFFGLFLIPIAGFYLAFTAYFGDKDAWQLEATAVAVFAVFGLVGVRVPFAVIIGYLLHIPWDAVHEFNAHAGGSLLVPRQITSVPLGYVFFCATYDFLMATYFYTRRNHWRAAWGASLCDGTTI